MKNLSLAVDVGNSQISLGLFEKSDLIARLDTATHEFEIGPFTEKLMKFIGENNISANAVSKGMICSVVPSLTEKVQIAVKTVFNIDIPPLRGVDNGIVTLECDNPEEVGGDLVADLVAAKVLYGYPCLVIDLGTLTKNLVLDKRGVFVGTSFYPGLQACLEAMSLKAELIPSAKELSVPKSYLGLNTLDAMQSGMYYGTVSQVVKTGELCQKYYNVEHLILTGGFAEFIGKGVDTFTIDPDLALKGINIIMNNQR